MDSPADRLRRRWPGYRRPGFATRHVESAFKKSGDPTLYGINVKAFMDATVVEFPAGFRYLVITRFALTTAGSLLVVILLTVPPGNAYFR